MFIFYLLLFVLPVWLVFRVTNNYSVLIWCRYFLKYVFLILCVISLASMIWDKMTIDTTTLTAIEIARKHGEVLCFMALTPLIWNIWMSLWGLKFYSASHIKNLDYFVLFLRSFKDDKKKSNLEYRLMRALYSFFCPFAVGRPKDIQTSSLSAIRLYVGDDWKENVAEMMEKTPILLLRISDTDNFFWEFEQCIAKDYIEKAIFWVSDKSSYIVFCEKASKEFGLSFPHVENITDNCLIYKERDNFSVFILNNNKSYTDFVLKYNELRRLTSTYSDYFGGRNVSLISQFFKWKRNPDMMEGVQKWCWTAFFFPSSYIIFQRFPVRGVLYLLSLVTLILFPIRIPLMIYMGRNAKKMVWLSEKWESVSYFEDIHHKNDLKAVGFAACIIIYYLCFFL